MTIRFIKTTTLKILNFLDFIVLSFVVLLGLPLLFYTMYKSNDDDDFTKDF